MGWRRRVVSAGVGYAVAGPGGALVGAALGGGDGEAWHDLSGVPFGVNVEVDAEDDAVGRRWTLTFLSEVPSPALAQVQLRDDAGRLVPGQAPFMDDRGHFTATGLIERGKARIYAPFGAAVPEPKARVSLEVAVLEIGDRIAPVGRATLDGALPTGELDVAHYLAPVVRLLEDAGVSLPGPALEALAEQMGLSDAEARPIRQAADDLSSDEARRALRFRFSDLDREDWRTLTRGVVEDAGDLDAALEALGST